MYDALVISDTHLGSDNCQARPLVRFLESVHAGELLTHRLILNGDVFDSIDFRRLKKKHWKVLSLIRKLSDDIEIVWILGNHDGPAEGLSHLLGVEVREEVVVRTGGRRVLCLHGHRFDEFIERYPLTSNLADWMYRWLQRIDKSHTIARTAKHTSKAFLRNAEVIRRSAVEYAAELGCDAVCCGHTHLPAAKTGDAVEYYNSGSWTERPAHYLAMKDGVVELLAYHDELAEESVPQLGVVPAVA